MNLSSYLKDFLSGLQKAVDAQNNKKKIDEDLKGLQDYIDEQNKFNDVPSVPEYERYNYEAPSDESIKETAESELSSYLDSGEKSIKDEYERKGVQLGEDKAAASRNFDENKAQLKSAYDESAEKLGNDALRRGLARSSIALNNQAQANATYNNALGELIRQNYARQSEIDEELNGLSSELESALNSFRIDYAAKLTRRINELKEEREKNKLDAIKYNNSLSKDEFEQNLKASDERANRQPLTYEQQMEIEKRIMKKFVEFLDGLPKADAQKLIEENPIFRDNLSSSYYQLLKTRYQ